MSDCAAVEEGEKDEDKLVATIMGAEDVDGMTDLQQQYKDKIKAQIAKVGLLQPGMVSINQHSLTMREPARSAYHDHERGFENVHEMLSYAALCLALHVSCSHLG